MDGKLKYFFYYTVVPLLKDHPATMKSVLIRGVLSR